MLSALCQDIENHVIPVHFAVFGAGVAEEMDFMKAQTCVSFPRVRFTAIRHMRHFAAIRANQLVFVWNLARNEWTPSYWKHILDCGYTLLGMPPLVILFSQDATSVIRAEIVMRKHLVRLGFWENHILAMRGADEETMLCLIRMGQNLTVY
jgi:hypothetical protein